MEEPELEVELIYPDTDSGVVHVLWRPAGVWTSHRITAFDGDPKRPANVEFDIEPLPTLQPYPVPWL